VATLNNVVSRPVPPRPITVWGFAGTQLVSPEVTLFAGATRHRGASELTYFEDYSG
jgi:hypothetical protein